MWSFWMFGGNCWQSGKYKHPHWKKYMLLLHNPQTPKLTYRNIDRKFKTLLIGSTVGKREKWGENTIVETTSVNQLHWISSCLAILIEVLHRMAVLDLVLLSLVFKLYPNSLVQKIPYQRRRPLYHLTLDKMVNFFFICYKMSCIQKNLHLS